MSFSHTSTVPISMLPGIGQRTAQVLRSMDIKTVGQFKTVPEKILIELFGPSIRSVYAFVHNKNMFDVSPSILRQGRSQKKKRLKARHKLKVASLMFSMML